MATAVETLPLGGTPDAAPRKAARLLSLDAFRGFTMILLISHGFGFQVAYTWSKNLSNVGFDAANINKSTDMAQQYGQTPFSRPHRLVINYQYELPFKGDGVLGYVAQGWAIGGLTTLQSGNALTLFDNRGGSVYGTPGSGTVENGMSRAQLCPGFTYSQIETSGNVKDRLGSASNPSAPRFFNTSAFCAPPAIGNDGSFDFGNTGIGIVRGPHQLNFDFQTAKTTRIGERQTIQFRAEFFNIFNRVNFQAPNQNNQVDTVSSAGFGSIRAANDPRIGQMALKIFF